MRLLLDTHLLLRAAGMPEQLSTEARALLDAPENGLYLIAQAMAEGLTLLTTDELVAQYPGPIRRL